MSKSQSNSIELFIGFLLAIIGIGLVNKQKISCQLHQEDKGGAETWKQWPHGSYFDGSSNSCQRW